METYGIITTCKGRLEHLKQTLPAMLDQPRAPFVTVVDYGCPDGTFDWCVEQRHPRLQAILVLDNTRHFGRSHAKNIGAVRTPTSILCFVDADCILTPRWLQLRAESLEAGADICLVDPMQDGASGTCAIRSAVFHQLRGYDEALVDWGYEDSDLYSRAENYGCRISRYGIDQVRVFQHDDGVRCQYHESKDPVATWNQNRSISKNPGRGRINPKGYGIGRCLIRRSVDR